MEWLWKFLFPEKCVVCGKSGRVLCGKCLMNLPVAYERCPECSAESKGGWTHQRCKKSEGMERLIVLYSYRDRGVKKVIREIKYRFRVELIKIMIDERKAEGEIVLVPIPLYWKRKNWRGFNQAEEIAKVLGKRKIKVMESLERVKETRSLTELSAGERRKEMSGAFEIKKGGESLRGKNVWLVDDVFTSGATMREAAKVLKKNGVRRVWGWALAS